MINLEKINLKTDIAMSDKPDIQLIHNASYIKSYDIKHIHPIVNINRDK